MRKVLGSISGIVALLLLCSGAFTDLFKFVSWLFTLQYSAPETSIAGGIVVRASTFLASFSLVGIIFNVFHFFDSKLMSFAYFVISSLLGFAFSYVVWSAEQHIVIVGIIFGSIAVISTILFVIGLVARTKEKKPKDEALKSIRQGDSNE